MLKIVQLNKLKDKTSEFQKFLDKYFIHGTKPETKELGLSTIHDFIFFGCLLDTFKELTVKNWYGSEKKWYELDGWGFSDDFLNDIELQADIVSKAIKRFKKYRQPDPTNIEKRKNQFDWELRDIRWKAQDIEKLKKLLEE